MEENKNSKPMVLISVLVHLLLFGVTFYISFKAFEFAGLSSKFSYHPTFMAIGYLILMTNAIMSMAGNNVFTTNFTRSNRLTVHWVLQALAGILIFIASICMYLNKIDRQAQHFTTWHGTIGLVTIILTLASIFGGVFTKYSFQLRETVTPIVSKLIHSFMGIATYLLGIVTIILGMYSDWFSYVSSASIQATLLCLAILTSIYVISKSAVTFFARVKTFMTKT